MLNMKKYSERARDAWLEPPEDETTLDDLEGEECLALCCGMLKKNKYGLFCPECFLQFGTIEEFLKTREEHNETNHS